MLHFLLSSGIAVGVRAQKRADSVISELKFIDELFCNQLVRAALL